MPPSTTRSSSRHSRPNIVATLTMIVVLALSAGPLGAQQGAKRSTPRPSGNRPAPSLVGTWSGTATVPLNDSSIVVPVVYTFTQDGVVIGGTAMVPGQGAGPISDVVRTGSKLTFRVGAPEGRVLEHEGALTVDGAIEGIVKLDKEPVAKFRITQKAKQ